MGGSFLTSTSLSAYTPFSALSAPNRHQPRPRPVPAQSQPSYYSPSPAKPAQTYVPRDADMHSLLDEEKFESLDTSNKAHNFNGKLINQTTCKNNINLIIPFF
jgi:hypothetical protein